MDVVAIHEDWSAGRGYLAGRAIYDAIPVADRPAWAADIVELASSAMPVTNRPVTAFVTVVARNPAWWQQAHNAFRGVRRQTLAFDKTKTRGAAYGICLLVAENAAKVVYNASGEPDVFDEDCGCGLVSCLRQFVSEVGDPQLAEKAWTLLADWLRRGDAEPGSVLSSGDS